MKEEIDDKQRRPPSSCRASLPIPARPARASIKQQEDDAAAIDPNAKAAVQLILEEDTTNHNASEKKNQARTCCEEEAQDADDAANITRTANVEAKGKAKAAAPKAAEVASKTAANAKTDARADGSSKVTNAKANTKTMTTTREREMEMKMGSSSRSSSRRQRGYFGRRRTCVGPEPDLEATGEGALVPMPPGGGSSSREFELDCSMSMSMSMSMPGAVRVKGIDNTDDDDSETTEIDAASTCDNNVPPPQLQLQRNDGGRMHIIQSRPGAFTGLHNMCCFDSGSTSNFTFATDMDMTTMAGGSSSILSLGDPLRGSLVKQNDGLSNQAFAERVDTVTMEEALEVKPFPDPAPNRDGENENNEPKRRCGGTRFYVFLRAVCILWIIGFVLGLLFRPDSSTSSYHNYKKQDVHSMQPGRPSTNGRTYPRANDNSDSEDDEATQTPTLYPPFNQTLLKAGTIKLIQQDPQSPQYKANAWLLQDPSLHDYPDWKKLQRFGLATTYFATNGDSWYRNDDWLSYNVSECLWYTSSSSGNDASTSSCDDQGRLIVQDLSNNNLTGSPPKEAQLPSVRRVDHSNNDLSGRFPCFSANMGSMQELVYSNNGFEGPLVVDGGMTAQNIRILKLDNNAFAGSIHKGFHLFPQLQVLNLTRNQFEGTVPLEVRHLPQLESLGLGDNLYRGTIPTEFGLLTQLRDLDLSGNLGIQATLPTELGSLQWLNKLDISNTAITGHLPEELCSKQATGELELVANCSLVHCCWF